MALPAQSAADLKVHLGSVLRLQDLSTKPLSGSGSPVCSGRATRPLQYWALDLIGPAGYRSADGFDTYGPAVVDQAAFAQAAGARQDLPVGQVSYLALPESQHRSGRADRPCERVNGDCRRDLGCAGA